MTEIIHKLLFEKREREQRIKNQLSYVESTHSAPILPKKLFEIYTKLQNNMETKC